MVSKEDAIELEKIMKRRLNSPASGLKEVHLEPAVQHEAEAVSLKTVQELRIIDVPEALDKTATETSENEVSKIPIKHYVNPFQNGSKRFTPCSVKRLDNGETNCSSQQSDLKGSQIIPSFEIRQRTKKQGCCCSYFRFFQLLYSLSKFVF